MYAKIPFKYALKLESKGLKAASFGEEDGIYPFLSSGQKIKSCNSFDHDGEYIVIGDGGIFNSRYINGKFSASDHTLLYAPLNNAYARFVSYYLEANKDELDMLTFKGMGMRNINREALNRIEIPLPDLATQQRIAAFLDAHTAKIDTLSSELTKFKANLLLQKRSLVSECVTKGIPSERDREYKDSGLDYLSNAMPLVWDKVRLKNVLSGTSSGATPSSGDDSYYTDDENAMRWVSIGDMGENFTSSTKNSVTEKALKDCRLKVVPSGTLLYSMYASVGFVSELTMNATTNQAILALYLDNETCNKRFVKYWLKNMRFYVDRLTSVSTQSNLNANKVINLDLFLPPLDEQQRIADYLDIESAKIDALIGEIDNQVNLLKTYRKSLINEVVTGKVEV